MRNFLSLVLAALACLCVADRAAAQCFPIPGTGCPGQNPVVCNTAPAIGTNFTFSCPASCGPSVAQSIILGIPILPLPLPSPPLCVTGCNLGCQPMNVFPGPTFTIPIPNNITLVGVQLCLQCACQIAGTICLTVSQATLVVIQ